MLKPHKKRLKGLYAGDRMARTRRKKYAESIRIRGNRVHINYKKHEDETISFSWPQIKLLMRKTMFSKEVLIEWYRLTERVRKCERKKRYCSGRRTDVGYAV